MGLITKIDRALARFEEILLALLLVSMVVLAAAQVLLRNVWDTGIDWADITLQNATLLLGMLGAAVATSEGRHLTIDIFPRLVTGRFKGLVRVIIGVFAVVLCVFLTQGGWAAYEHTLAQWKGTMPQGWTLGQNLRQEFLEGAIPQWLSLLILPCGFSLIGLHFLLRLVRDIHSLATGVEWELPGHAGKEGDAALDEMERHASMESGKEVVR